MSDYEALVWEWQNRRRLEETLAARAARMFPYPKRRFGELQRAEVEHPFISGYMRLETVAEMAERTGVDVAGAAERYEGPQPETVWRTVDELAEEFGLSLNTIKRHAGKVGKDDKRWRELEPLNRAYTWPWDRDGKFDESKYDPPGWRAYRKFSQSKNRDGDKRMPEAFRGHGQVLDSRRYVKMIGPSDRRSSTHGGVIGEQVEMMEADESLYSVDPGLAPRQDKGTRVTEYRLSAVREVIEARQPTAGRFTKRAGHAE